MGLSILLNDTHETGCLAMGIFHKYTKRKSEVEKNYNLQYCQEKVTLKLPNVCIALSWILEPIHLESHGQTGPNAEEVVQDGVCVCVCVVSKGSDHHKETGW